MPLWKQRISNFSLGLWIWSSSSPNPIISVSMLSVRLICSTTGMDPPLPIITAGRPYSCIMAARAAFTQGVSTSISMPGVMPKARYVTCASGGSRSATNFLNASKIACGSWSGTRRNETLADASDGMIVLLPSPV